MMAVDKLLKDSATTNENMTELEKKLGEKAKSLSKKMEDKVTH
jgi:flagellar motility protein MotE (MotC chaperone)